MKKNQLFGGFIALIVLIGYFASTPQNNNSETISHEPTATATSVPESSPSHSPIPPSPPVEEVKTINPDFFGFHLGMNTNDVKIEFDKQSVNFDRIYGGTIEKQLLGWEADNYPLYKTNGTFTVTLDDDGLFVSDLKWETKNLEPTDFRYIVKDLNRRYKPIEGKSTSPLDWAAVTTWKFRGKERIIKITLRMVDFMGIHTTLECEYD